MSRISTHVCLTDSAKIFNLQSTMNIKIYMRNHSRKVGIEVTRYSFGVL